MGIERTPHGRLWISWFGGDDSRDAYILLAKSDDDGKTWSKPLFIIDYAPVSAHTFNDTPIAVCFPILQSIVTLQVHASIVARV